MKTKYNMFFLMIMILLLFIWLAILISDYIHVMIHLEKPLFAQAAITADDGGSGTYRGIGYRIKIKGEFMPDAVDRGVSSASFYVFGVKVKDVLAD